MITLREILPGLFSGQADHDNYSGSFEELSTDLRILADYSGVFFMFFCSYPKTICAICANLWRNA